jgi:hypothetical protein
MIVSESGEVIAPVGFHETIEVDRSQFIKLYSEGVAKLNELSSAGVKVFKLLYSFVADNPGKDLVYLHHKSAKNMGKATFDRGLTELIAKELLYRSTKPSLFFLNVNYVFNGNRLAVIKEYRLQQQKDDSWEQVDLPLE